MKPKVLVLTGYGINCDEETAWVFNQAGGDARIVHVNDLVDGRERLSDWQILVFPGGFSYGDDTGSGKALANRIRNNLADPLRQFVDNDHLVLGICNGFQVLTCLGLLPDPQAGTPQAALTYNNSARYICRWVDLSVEPDTRCVFTRGMSFFRAPVAHGEGRFTTDPETYDRLAANGQIVLRYALSPEKRAEGAYPANPNGSLHDVAGICDPSGRIFGLMPHPERACLFLQQDNWPSQAAQMKRLGEPLPLHSDSHQLFCNAVKYFQ